jgi:hypothetical protein
MKSIYTALVFILCFTVSAVSAEDKFQYDWDIKYGDDGVVTFISKHPAPIPFSQSGEPAATMALKAFHVEPDKTLESIVAEEVADIKKTLKIEEYEEDDYKLTDNIVVYYKTIGGTKTAFIKYRTRGYKESPSSLPRTVYHAIFIKGKLLYFVHLIVLYAEGQEKMRADQIYMVETIINRKN